MRYYGAAYRAAVFIVAYARARVRACNDHRLAALPGDPTKRDRVIPMCLAFNRPRAPLP